MGYVHFEFYKRCHEHPAMHAPPGGLPTRPPTPTKVILLMGGSDLWSNGIHLNVIEAADQPHEESWSSINAMDDLVHEILDTDSHVVVSALAGNAGAGRAPRCFKWVWSV